MLNTKKMPLWAKWIIVLVLAFAVLGVVYAVQTANNKLSVELSLDDVQKIVDDTMNSLPNSVATGAKYVEENTTVTVESFSYGTEKDIILECKYETLNVGKVIEENLGDYLTGAYSLYAENEKNGKKTNATKIKLHVSSAFEEDLKKAEKIEDRIVIYLYETEKGVVAPYLSDEFVNTVFGGMLDAAKLVGEAKTVEYEGKEISIANQNTLRTGIKDCFALSNYDSKKPDTAIPLVRAWNSFKYDFDRNFIQKNQYRYITDGLVTTLKITALAVLLGIVIGFIVAVIRVTNQKTGKLGTLSAICKVYLSIMRGTPVMVQLLIVYFVVLLPIGVEKFPAAVLCFGLNSGAYVSEIVRGGIVSIDAGQMEAGRSLGFNYMQTMFYIVIPQAFKAVLPSLANEFITLLKESSVAFYIGVADLTQGGLKIRSITYSNYMPLIAVALIYLVVVLGLTKCVSILERRLQKGDKS